MAKIEAWEAANEFGIPETTWQEYDVRRRSDDLYIAGISSIFDALRRDDPRERSENLAAIARTLVIYSRSAAAKHLSGVERSLNQLYCAALYYISDAPATASLLTRNLYIESEIGEAEFFLRDFLRQARDPRGELGTRYAQFLRSGRQDDLDEALNLAASLAEESLDEGPQVFIARKLTHECLKRFERTNIWGHLATHSTPYDPEAWGRFLAAWGSFPLLELLPSQITALEHGILRSEQRTVSLQMPTSSGKTSLCELLLYHETKVRGRRVLFLVPFRALAAEIAQGMSRRLESAGVQVIASYGGNLPTRSETTTVVDAEVLISTPEKFGALCQVIEGLESEFQTIVCDEGHLIDDEGRGLAYELLLAKLNDPAAVDRKFVFLSAILPNVGEINRWLGGDETSLARSDYKPVPVDHAFLEKVGGDNWNLTVNPQLAPPHQFTLEGFLTARDFRFLNQQTGHQNFIPNRASYATRACCAALRARQNGPVAVFTTTRGDSGIRGLASKLLFLFENTANIVGEAPVLGTDSPLVMEYVAFSLGETHELPRLLTYGAGYHHGKLPQEMRRIMEEGLEGGSIQILLCTSTLAEGVNMPIRTLVVHTFKRFNPNQEIIRPIPYRSIKNIIGRVGRAGKETRGRIIYANDTERHIVLDVIRDQGLEPAKGILFRLISAVENHFRANVEGITNQVLDAQDEGFLNLIDNVDRALIDLLPAETPDAEVEPLVDELLGRTLAANQDQTESFRAVMRRLFQLRSTNLLETISRDAWPELRKSGASPREWRQLDESVVLQSPLWATITNPLDENWLREVIDPLINEVIQGGEMTGTQFTRILTGWMSGETYFEIAEASNTEVDQVLAVIADDIGYRLQERASTITQLMVARAKEDELTETAQGWPSLLQYGISTLQQLDLCEYGVTDRFAVWGVSRWLDDQGNGLRKRELIAHIRSNANEVLDALRADPRVPDLCVGRFSTELRLNY
jgi:superfamily II DNA/RNA helicase